MKHINEYLLGKNKQVSSIKLPENFDSNELKIFLNSLNYELVENIDPRDLIINDKIEIMKNIKQLNKEKMYCFYEGNISRTFVIYNKNASTNDLFLVYFAKDTLSRMSRYEYNIKNDFVNNIHDLKLEELNNYILS